MSEIGVYVPVDAVFPDTRADLDTFRAVLRGLSRTDALIWCARLNLAISNPEATDHLAAQEHAIALFFEQSEIARIQRFATAHGGARRVSVFTRAQLLELMRWVAVLSEDRENDGTTFQDQGVRRQFARAALIASDIWEMRVFQAPLVAGSFPTKNDRMLAMGPFRQSAAMNARAT